MNQKKLRSKFNIAQLTNGSQIINSQYLIKSLQRKIKYNQYLFLGVDLKNIKWIHILLKQNFNPIFGSNKRQKINLSKVGPLVLFQEFVEINKEKYYCEVYEKLGPSFQTLFSKVKQNLMEIDLYQLLLELIRLVEKINQLNLVVGSLTPSSITFSDSYADKRLFLLNIHLLKKKSDQSQQTLNTRYCSKGAHLGRKTEIKDDLESICYILIDLYTKGQIFKDNGQDYLEQKHKLWNTELSTLMPKPFLNFFIYVINLNMKQDVKFYHWKNYFEKNIKEHKNSKKSYGFFYEKNNFSKPQIAIKYQSSQLQESQFNIFQTDEHIHNIQQHEQLQLKLSLKSLNTKLSQYK